MKARILNWLEAFSAAFVGGVSGVALGLLLFQQGVI